MRFITLVPFLLFIVSTFLTSCNTMEGVGKDIKAGGSKLEESARENK